MFTDTSHPPAASPHTHTYMPESCDIHSPPICTHGAQQMEFQRAMLCHRRSIVFGGAQHADSSLSAALKLLCVCVSAQEIEARISQRQTVIDVKLGKTHVPNCLNLLTHSAALPIPAGGDLSFSQRGDQG